MKNCYKCKIEKPEKEFSFDRTRADGLQAACKVCQYKYGREYFKTIRGKLARNRHEQTEKRRLSNERYWQSDRGRLTDQQKSRRRRELKQGLDSQFTREDAKAIHIRFNHQCFNCGSVDRLEIDHHYPLSRGYSLSIDNAVLLCKSCNSSKHNQLPDDFYTQEKLEQLKCLLEVSQ